MTAAIDWPPVQAAAAESYRAVCAENGGSPWDSMREAYLEGFEAGFAAADPTGGGEPS